MRRGADYIAGLRDGRAVFFGQGAHLGLFFGREADDDARGLRAILGDTDPDLVLLVLDVGNPFPPTFTPTAIVRRYPKRIPVFHLRDSVAGKEVLFGAVDLRRAREPIG